VDAIVFDAHRLDLWAVHARGNVVRSHLRNVPIDERRLATWQENGWAWEIKAARSDPSEFRIMPWPVIL